MICLGQQHSTKLETLPVNFKVKCPILSKILIVSLWYTSWVTNLQCWNCLLQIKYGTVMVWWQQGDVWVMGTHGDIPADYIFDAFLKAGTCKTVLSSFHQLCEALELKHTNHRLFYRRLSSQLTSWKAQTVWVKLNKRMAQREYRKGEACANTRVSVRKGRYVPTPG